MTVAPMPAGWYRDPSARHEQRYWDGTAWSSHVVDAGLSSEDPPTSMPGFTGAALAVGTGVPMIKVSFMRWWLGPFAAFVFILAAIYEVLSYVIAMGTTSRSDESWLQIWAWLYHVPETFFGTQYVARPPLLLLLALFVAPICIRSIYNINRGEALLKAGARIARFWASPQDKAQWAYLQARLADAGVNRTISARARDYVFCGVAAVCSLLAIWFGYVALSERSASTISGEVVGYLSVGYGPWVAVISGVVGLVGALALSPIGARVLIRPDGTVVDKPG